MNIMPVGNSPLDSDMPGPPVRIQLAIQGGGAKIAALLATLEAVNELQAQGALLVTRIAGTSAGAIVGCLYAAGENLIPQARAKLSGVRASDINKIFPSPWPLRPRSSLMLLGLARGNPLWGTAFIEKFLIEILQEAGDFDLIADLKPKRNIDVKIISTDLTNSRKVVHDEKDPLIGSLMDSCGIPYCFRTWSKSGSAVIVDGGISENLPSEELDSPQDVQNFGRVVGISFKRPPRKEIKSILNFSTSLLDAAMQNSMERARSRLGDGSVFSIETNLDTFDFVKALESGLDPTAAYGYVRERARAWFRDFVERQRTAKQVIVGDPWSTQGIPLLERIGKMFDAQHRNTRFAYERCSVTVQARSLLSPSDDEYGKPDFIHYRGRFRTLADRVYCHSILVSDATQATTLERTSWHVLDLSKNLEIRAIDLPMRSKESENSRSRELLLFLDPILEPNSGPYLFDFKDLVDGFLKPLAEEGADELVFIPRQAKGLIGRIDLVVFLPRDFPQVKLAPQSGENGREMSQDELVTQYDVPQGYRAVGWTGTALPQDARFGIDITKVTH